MEKIEDILSKIENGRERFYSSPMVHNIVLTLLQGADPISVIDKLIIINEENNDKMQEYISKGPAPIIILQTLKEELALDINPYKFPGVKKIINSKIDKIIKARD